MVIGSQCDYQVLHCLQSVWLPIGRTMQSVWLPITTLKKLSENDNFLVFFIVFDTVHTWEPSGVSGSKTNTWRLRAIIWQQTTKENLQLQTVVFFVFLCLISVKLSLDWRFSAKIFHFWGYLSKSEDLNIFETFMSLSYIQYSNKGTCFFSSTMSKIFFI